MIVEIIITQHNKDMLGQHLLDLTYNLCGADSTCSWNTLDENCRIIKHATQVFHRHVTL